MKLVRFFIGLVVAGIVVLVLWYGWNMIVGGGAVIAPTVLSDEEWQMRQDYIQEHIETIVNDSIFDETYDDGHWNDSQWFAVGMGFVSDSDVYVDVENGMVMVRALLSCSFEENGKCTPIAFFEKEPGAWRAIIGQDTMKDMPIIHTWALDYTWER